MKECVVVLGMHRSGTSVLTGLVSFFGAYVGSELMATTKDNPKGYFENNKIYVLNEKILRENNVSWDNYSFVVEDISDKQFQSYVAEAKAIIEDELKYVKTTTIKDPRICILFPIWEQALKELCIKIKIIFAYRSPLEVAQSLQKRDGIAIEKGLMLWSHYFLQSELYSRKHDRMIVEYDADFRDLPVFLERLAEFIGFEVTKELLEKSKDFYSPRLKHHEVKLENISDDLPSYLREIISLLSNKKLNAKKKLDGLRNEFSHSKKFYLYNDATLIKDIKGKNEENSELEENIRQLKKTQQIQEQQQEQEKIQQQKIYKQQLLEKDNAFSRAVEELNEVKLELAKNIETSKEDSIKLKAENAKKDQGINKLEREKAYLNSHLKTGDEVFNKLIADKAIYRRLIGSTAASKVGKISLLFANKKTKKLFNEKKQIRDSGLFSTFYYLSRYPDIWNAKVDPLDHYCRKGWKEGRQPSDKFDIAHYQKENPEVVKANINPLLHYIRTGGNTPLASSDNKKKSQTIKKSHVQLGFDEAYYLANNIDIVEKGIDPYKHFIDHGWKEGRDPNKDFSTSFYLSANPDVKRSGQNPFQHYLEKGKKEQRLPKLGKVRRIEPSSTAPSILFVGHSAAQGGAEVVLLDIIQWYAENTNYKISILLLSSGILAGKFMEYGDVLTLNSADELLSEETNQFLNYYYDLIYLNTVVSGSFAEVYETKYKKLAIPVLLHVHEMQNIIEIYKDNFNSIVDHVDLFITASGRVKDDLVKYYSIPKKKISVHHSFVQNKAGNPNILASKVNYAREYFQLNDDDIVIMGSGTVNWRKAPDLFVETVSKIIKQCRGKNIIGIWMGAGEELEALEAQVDEQGLGANIKFTGFLKNASELVAAADLFFLSSREDPFPLVCLEAAQYKIPTVCFEKATGMVEFIKDDAGLSIAEIDTDLAAAEMVSLINDEPRRELLGFNARARFMNYYCSDRQIKTIFHKLKSHYSFKPSLSVIIPNFNHSLYLNERIDSVINQSFYDQEILILDDASTDNSLDIIGGYKEDPRVKVIANKKCSGSPFKQWKKGVNKAKADFIWIAESDDSCSMNFVKTLLPAFNDKNLVLSYCKSEIIDEKGTLIPDALTPYMERAHPTKFKKSYAADGNKEVEENFAVSCTIVNGSSVIFKKESVVASLDKAMKFKMCGDWLIYLEALYNGRIAYSTDTTNYFRRHQTSTVHKVEGTDLYFKERFEIAKEIVQKFNVSKTVFDRMLSEVDSEWARFKHIDKKQSYEDLFDKALLTETYEKNTVAPMKIGFYVHGFMFSKGGIERLAADLANFLSSRGHQVVIFCRVYKGDEPIYQINNDISVIPVFDESKANIKTSTGQLRESLKAENLDVFIPMLSEWIFDPVIDAAKGLGFPIIASEHNNPEVIEKQWWSHEERVKAFEKVNVVHLLRDNYKKSLPDAMQEKIHVIQNGSYLGKWVNTENKKTYKRIIAIGRLAPQKRFDRLIQAFATATADIDNDWTLDIYGDGPNQAELQKLIKSFQLEHRISLKGNNDNIEREYLTSDLFVLPSEFEGDPVVLVEAKMFGLPCIGYENCPGTNEAIHDGVDGLLAKPDDDGAKLSKSIVQLLNNSEQRIQFGLKSKESSKHLDMNNIAHEWEALLSDTCKSYSLDD